MSARQQTSRSSQRAPIKHINTSKPVIPKDEEDVLNKYVDQMIADHEIKSVAPEVIPKLTFVMNSRLKMAMGKGEYAAVEKIQKNLASLRVMRSDALGASLTKLDRKLAEERAVRVGNNCSKAIEDAERKILDVEEKKDHDVKEMDDVHQKAVEQVEAEKTRMLERLKNERKNVQEGTGFRPSAAIRKAREMELRFAKSGQFDEAKRQKAIVDNDEMTERNVFQKKSEQRIDSQEKACNTDCKSKTSSINNMYGAKKERIREKAEAAINSLLAQIEKMKGRYQDATGREYVRQDVADIDPSDKRSHVDEEEQENAAENETKDVAEEEQDVAEEEQVVEGEVNEGEQTAKEEMKKQDASEEEHTAEHTVDETNEAKSDVEPLAEQDEEAHDKTGADEGGEQNAEDADAVEATNAQ